MRYDVYGSTKMLSWNARLSRADCWSLIGDVSQSCLEYSTCRTLSRCWISGLSPSSSAASLHRSLDDVYTPYMCNPSEVLHLQYSSSSTCSTTWPWGRLRLSSPTTFVQEHSRTLSLQRYEHRHYSVTLQLHRIDRGEKVCRNNFVFCFEPQQWY
jgi:hypothetical protein